MRHRRIFKTLKKFGIRPTDNILEVGCGIGTVSSLIIPHNRKGHYTAVDISPESIAIAKQQYEQNKRNTIPCEIVSLPSAGKIYPENHPLRSGQIEMRFD